MYASLVNTQPSGDMTGMLKFNEGRSVLFPNVS